MNAPTSRRALLLALVAPLALLVLFSMDLAPGRYLVTYRADRFAPWGPPSEAPSFNADCLRSYYPRRVVATEALRAGRVPLWDPSSFCGQPFLANFQAGVFYPVNLALAPLAPARQMGVFVWLHLLLAAWGTTVLLRGLGRSPGASVVAGLLYASGGAIAVRTGQPTMLAAGAWLPLFLFGAGRVAEGKRSVAPFAIVSALTILAGFPPILIWSTLLAAAWALHRWWAVRRGAGVAPLARAAFGYLLGAGIAAAQLAPTAELVAWSDRIRFDYLTLLSSSWHPAALLGMILPGFFGTPFDDDTWIHLLGRGDGHYWQSYISTAAYVGVGALVFAAVGARAAWRDRSGRFLLAAGGVGALLLLGSPLLHIVSWLPLVSGARVDRVVHVFVLALVAAAAFGIDRWRDGEGRKTGLAAAGVLAFAVALLFFARRAVALLLAGAASAPFIDAGPAFPRAIHAALFLAGVAALFALPSRVRGAGAALAVAGALLVLDPGLASRPCHVTVSEEELPHETDGIRVLQDLAGRGRIVRYRDSILPPNLPALFGLEDVAGYNALNIRDYREYYETFAPGSVKERRINPLEELGAPLLGMLHELNARYLLTEGEYPLDGFAPIYEGEAFRVYENRNLGSHSRAYFARRVRQGLTREEVLGVMKERTWYPGAAFVEDDDVRLDESASATGTVGEWLGAHGGGETALVENEAIDGQVIVARHDPERVVIDCAPATDRFLVLRDSYFPGWKATVDGAPAVIHRTNRIFRGVVVPAGVHRVEFRYEPLSFRIGLFVSALSLLGTALLFARAIFLRRRAESR